MPVTRLAARGGDGFSESLFSRAAPRRRLRHGSVIGSFGGYLAKAGSHGLGNSKGRLLIHGDHLHPLLLHTEPTSTTHNTAHKSPLRPVVSDGTDKASDARLGASKGKTVS